ncbi:PIN domain-containing protein [Candidatus Bipolaricaulota bacterium]|nr:PIN domain-containing protein [Candidatus Bipolaricaulota bacterium]
MPQEKSCVDTCFLLRYLTGTPPEQAEEAERVLRQAQAGAMQLVVPAMVIAELIWVLESSVFKLSKAEAAEKAIAVLNMKGVKVENASLLEEAAVLHAELNIDFTDAYLACFAKAKSIGGIYTFDRAHFQRVPWVKSLP